MNFYVMHNEILQSEKSGDQNDQKVISRFEGESYFMMRGSWNQQNPPVFKQVSSILAPL